MIRARITRLGPTIEKVELSRVLLMALPVKVRWESNLKTITLPSKALSLRQI
jgi:hypothetical protein